MDTDRREHALVLRAQCGDRGAFDELLQRVDTPLLRYVETITGSRSAAEDILQDALVTIVRKISWLRDPALFRNWAFRIASRTAFRAMRKQLRPEPLDDGLASIERDAADPWLLQRLALSLPRLSEASRAVIHLHYLEEMSLSDVAAVLEISPGTVKSRLAYGLAQLRKELT